MREVNITELRNRLPTYMKAVQRGEPINIISRGKVIARIVPAEDPALAARQRLIDLREKCWVGDVLSPSDEAWEAEHDRKAPRERDTPSPPRVDSTLNGH